MPMRRYKKKTYKRRSYRNKKSYKRFPLSRIPIKNQIHHFKRAYAGGLNIPSNVLNTQFFAYVFKCSSMVNSTDFTNLYDQFRLNKLVMTFRLVNDPGNSTVNSKGLVLRLLYYLDYDDQIAPTTINEFRERAKTKIVPLSPYRPVSVKWTPSCLVSGFESTVNTMYMPKFKQWLDMSDFGTDFFGIKFAIDNFAENLTPFTVEIDCWYYFSCKNIR